MQRLGLPASLNWFVFTAILYGLQMFPLPGIFLMMLMAPFWSVLTINAGFASLAVESLTGSINRLWLIAPVAWFGGYAVATTLSHMEASRPEAAMTERFAFDPSRESLVLDESTRILNLTKQQLLAGYPLDVIYAVDETARGIHYLAYRLGSKTVCQSIKDNADYLDAGIRVEPRNYFIEQAIGEDMCIYAVPEEPKFDPVVVSATMEKKNNLLLQQTIYRIGIDGNGQPLRFSIAEPAAPLTWLPLPVLGCFLIDNPSSWQCITEFWREQPNGRREDMTDKIRDRIADALALKPATAAEHRAEIDAAPTPDFKAIVDARLKTFTDALDAVIADPSHRLSRSDIRMLFDKPALVAPRAAAMTGTIRTIFDARSGNLSTARLLEDLLVTLPWPQFEPAGRILLDDLGARERLKVAMFSDSFAARLGDFGASAVPVLSRLAFDVRPKGVPSAIIGLCRSGEAAAMQADKLNSVLTATRRTEPAHMAAFVTLLRLGRADLASADPAPDIPAMDDRYGRALKTITPQSPNTVCDTVGLEPKLPERDS